jgi:MrcB-like, N-terminal domain
VEGSQRKGYWSGKIRTPGLSCLSIDSADYEAGNIVARFYAADSVPDEQVLKDDLRAMLAPYDVLGSKKIPTAKPWGFCKVHGSAKAYAPNLRRTMPARPTRPVPISIRLLGSGTADVVTCS